jgi:crotonobetainyl-CoA:carnitine CoA-transferase CaiB-like acyl-CoA transferase
LKDRDGNDTTDSAYYLCANRGKKSITLDITTPDGQQRVRELAMESDVLVENYKVGGLAKYGLDYASLSALNPRLVYCSITGFGQTGPYAQRAGYDFLIQGMGGLMSLTGTKDGEPLKVGVALADIMTGLYATIGVQAALLERERSGLGQHVDLALLDVQVATLANQAMNYLVGGKVPGRSGNAHPNIVPYQAFAAADGHLILAIGNDGQFRRFCETAGVPDMGADSRYATNAARLANREELCTRIAALMADRSMDDWIAALEKAGVPCGPINTLDRVFRDPQVQARAMVQQVEHPLAGPIPTVRNPILFSRSRMRLHRAPPLLGEDNT